MWGYYTQYLYLPRLRDASVLLGAVEDGVALVTWRDDAFAYADAYDESAARFAGLRAGQRIELADPVGLVVRPGMGDAQLEAERAAHQAATSDRALGAEAPRDVPATPVVPDEEGEQPAQVLRRFFGTVTLDPTRLSRDASEVGEAVVAHLNGLVDAEVTVTLEIHAEIPEGVPENVVRTVTENAMTLRFDPSTGFETE